MRYTKFNFRNRMWYFFSALLIFSALLGACGGDVAPTSPPQPTSGLPTATSTPLPPTKSPTPIPTATLVPEATKEWGSVKSNGAEVKAVPDNSASTLERLAGFTIVAWQRKLPDGTWLERAGGGWVRRNDVVVYGSEAEARRSVPLAGSPASNRVPTYNPIQPTVGRSAYTYAPVVGPGSVPQYFTQAAVPATPTSASTGAVATATSVSTATPTSLIARSVTPATPLPTVRPGTTATAGPVTGT